MRYILLILASILAFNARSQKEFSGGLIAGLVTSQISGDGMGGWDKFGGCAGGWVRIPVSDKAGIIMNMQYINKGSLRTDTLTHTSYGFALDYIEMPILWDHKTNLINQKIHWQLGPSFGYNIRQKVKSNGAFFEPIPAFTKYDIGVIGGIAFEFTAKYQLIFRTSTSLIPTRPAPTTPIPNSYYLKGNYNQTMQLLFSVRL